MRDAACPLSTRGGTRLVRLVRGRGGGGTAAASRAPSHHTPPTRETHSPSPSPRGPPLGESPLATIVRSPRPPSASPSGVRAPLRGGTRGERAAAWPRRGGAAGLPRVSPVATSHARRPGVSCHGNAASGTPPLCSASDTSPPPASACRSGSRAPRGSAGPWTCPIPAPRRAAPFSAAPPPAVRVWSRSREGGRGRVELRPKANARRAGFARASRRRRARRGAARSRPAPRRPPRGRARAAAAGGCAPAGPRYGEGSVREEGRDASSQYGRRDETRPVSTGGRGGGSSLRGRACRAARSGGHGGQAGATERAHTGRLRVQRGAPGGAPGGRTADAACPISTGEGRGVSD